MTGRRPSGRCKMSASPLGPPPAPRIVGTHDVCGGDILYQTTPGQGWRFCNRCPASSMRGDAITLTTDPWSEAKKKESAS